MQRIYVLFFISLATRRVEYVACTSNPDGVWTAQQARNLMMQFGDEQPFRLLIHDRDAKLAGAFDEVFRSAGCKVIRTPLRAPNANAYAERWVRTVRADCIDHLLIVGRRHWEHALRVYVRHDNQHRPHRALRLVPPDRSTPVGQAEFPLLAERPDLLGGFDPRIPSRSMSKCAVAGSFVGWSCAAPRRCSTSSASARPRSASCRRQTTTGT